MNHFEKCFFFWYKIFFYLLYYRRLTVRCNIWCIPFHEIMSKRKISKKISVRLQTSVHRFYSRKRCTTEVYLCDVFCLKICIKWVREVTTLSLRIHMLDTRLFVCYAGVRVWIKYMSVATDQFSLEIHHEKRYYVIFWSLLYMFL